MRVIPFKAFIISLFGYVLSIQLPPLANRIVGGEDAKIVEVPYQLSLFELNLFIGGASVISSKWAVTAAHCVTDPSSGKLIEHLRVGCGNAIRNQGSFYNVLKTVRHSSYNKKTFDNDIALLEIDGTFLFSDKVKAVVIPNSEPKPGLQATVSGWGSTMDNRLFFLYPDTLKKVSVSIIDRELCKKLYKKKQRSVSNLMICAGDEKGGKDACQNDSGGPLVVNNVLYGIVSFGIGCGRADFPGVYTNVAKYASWIKKKTNK